MSKSNHNPEYWGVRGPGLGSGNGKCWISGEPVDLGPDLSGFVTSREAGARVVALLGNAHLDYREHEPDWIQVKIAVRKEHEPALERLYEAVEACDGILTERIVEWARDPESSPGYKPKALDYRDRLNELVEKNADDALDAQVNDFG